MKTFTCLYTSVYSGFIYNHPKLQTTQISFSPGTDKQTVVCPYDSIMHTIKSKKLLILAATGWIANAECKKPAQKAVIPFIPVSGKGKTIGVENRPGAEGRERN